MKASYSTETHTPDDLVAAETQLVDEKVATPADGTALSRGTLMGKKTAGSVSGALTGTGNGTLTSPAAKDDTIAGDYTIELYDDYNDIWKVTDPNGDRLADAVTGVAYDTEHLSFTIVEGGTPYDTTSKWTVTVAAGDGTWVKSLAAAVDGSQNPRGILAEDVAAGDGYNEGEALVYTAGEFREGAITLGTGHTVASVRDDLHKRGIYLR